MRICVLYFDGCPNHELTVNRVSEVSSRLGIEASVEEVELTDPGQVAALRFLGSPTVQIDGMDIEPDARSRNDFAYSCRMYGSSGVPAEALLEAALSEAIRASCCDPEKSPAASERKPLMSKPRSGHFASLGSVTAAVIGTACCWLPPLLLVFGLSEGGIARLFATARPVFLTMAFLCLGIGFFNVYRARRSAEQTSDCCRKNSLAGRVNQVMLWTALVVVLVMTFFPSLFTNLIGNGNDEISTTAPLVTLAVEGMDCEACSGTIRSSLEKVPGVTAASVSYDEKIAQVNVLERSPAAELRLIEAIEMAGFHARVAPSNIE